MSDEPWWKTTHEIVQFSFDGLFSRDIAPSLLSDYGTKTMKIYVASSWRNQFHELVVTNLKTAGYEVYDFKNPGLPEDHGFHWSEIDPNWKNWSPKEFIAGLEDEMATSGFFKDMFALSNCHVCVLVLPCGRSAHLEAGWAAGAGKRLLVYMPVLEEPELMYRMAYAHNGLITDKMSEIMSWLKEYETGNK